MSRAMAADGDGDGDGERKKYKGVRRRRWGKWVSEIRVPGTRHRLWLGSYATAEAAAVAHDAAVFFLRGPDAAEGFNFPESAADEGCYWSRATSAGGQLSPQSVQRVASDAGMAADARLAVRRAEERELQQQQQQQQQHQQQQQQQQNQEQLLQQPAVLTGECWGPAGGDHQYWWSDYGEGRF